MPKPTKYTDEEILLALIWTMPKKQTKGQIGRLLGIKSAGQKHWTKRFERLKDKNLLSMEKLDAGELFFGAGIQKYYLTTKNLEQIWKTYFVNYDERHDLVNDPFLTPFSAGIWNVTSSPEFCKLVGSKFNYYFLCAKNEQNSIKLSTRIRTINKKRVWKIMDSVLSIGWKTEAYRRKPVLMETLSHEQKKAYDVVNVVYNSQIEAHPAEYKKFLVLFEESFRYYL